MIPEALAAKVAQYFVLQVTNGALEKLGADAKDYLQTLVGIIYSRFFGRREIQEAAQNPAALEAMIIEELPRDIAFRQDLESVVEKLVEIEENHNTGNVNQISINAPNNTGYIAGRDQNFR